jgi:hypothetical protein
MVSAETTRHLLRHAGLKDADPALVPSITSCTSSESYSDYLEDAIADFMRGMSRLNNELNATVSSRGDARAPDVPREVALAVAAVARMLRDYAEGGAAPARREAARRGARRIESAWTAVLAGDVDELRAQLGA